MVVAEGVKTRLEWGRGLQVRQDILTCLGLSCPTSPPHLTQMAWRPPEVQLGGHRSTRNGVIMGGREPMGDGGESVSKCGVKELLTSPSWSGPLPCLRVSSAPSGPHTASTHPSTSGKARIRACTRSCVLRMLGVPGLVGALVGPSTVGSLEAPGTAWARVTGHGSSNSRSSRRSRGCRLSTRGPSRPVGCTPRGAMQAGRDWSREAEKGRRNTEE